MMTMTISLSRSPKVSPSPDDRPWFITSRRQDYQGEERTNLLRIVAVTAFYLIELANERGMNLGFVQIPKVPDQAYHQAVTAVALAWVMLALGVHLCLRWQMLPAGLEYLTTILDIVLLTVLLMVANGPRSPMVVGYFLILAMATLRFRLSLIWCATLGVVVGYVWLLGWAMWIEGVRDVRVPRYHQLIVLTALALCGIIQGQVVRRVRLLVVEYTRRLTPSDGAPS
jgi:hypothetical protein